MHSVAPSAVSLGAFVRAMRARLPPPSGRAMRRRTPGLRREELADLCGISTTWLTWIEQDRPVTVSAAALARLARALQLSRAERAYLFARAGRHDPDAGTARPGDLPDSLMACLRAIGGPAYLLDPLCEARAWNGEAEALFTGWLDRPDAAGGHNLLRFLFQSPEARQLVADWPERSRRVVAEFRADWTADPAAVRLVAELSAASADFAAAWRGQAVIERAGGARLFDHPRRGRLRLHQHAFEAIGWSGLKLVLLIAPEGTAPFPP